MEKRSNARQAVHIAATLSNARQTRQAGLIKNFCSGGIFVETNDAETFAPTGETIRVDFESSGAQGAVAFTVTATVSAHFQHGMGLKFDNAPMDAVLALQTEAHRAAQTRTAMSQASLVPGSPAARVLEKCRDSARQFIEEQTAALFKEAEDILFSGARDAASNVEQTEQFDAMKELDSIKDPLANTFKQLVAEGMQNIGAPLPGPGSDQDTDGSGLALIDTKVFNDMLSVQKILDVARERYHDDEYDILARFSHVLGSELDAQDDPIGPAGVCGAFHNAVQNLGAGAVARRALFTAFERTVILHLGVLLNEINQHFIDMDILPVVEKPSYSVPKQKRGAPPPAPVPPTEPDSVTLGDPWDTGEIAVSPAMGHYAQGAQVPTGNPAATMAAANTSADTTAQVIPPGTLPAMPGAAAGASPGAPNTLIDPDAPQGPAVVNVQPGHLHRNAFHAGHNLMSLQRDIQAQLASGTGELIAQDMLPRYSSNDVANALASVQVQVASDATASHARTDLKALLNAQLAQAAPADGPQPVLSAQDEDTVQMVTGVVSSMLGDVYVADGIKPQLSRLEVPLARLAIQDHSFLANDQHPARQVIDRLSRIELPADIEPGSMFDDVAKQIDTLVNRLVSAPELNDALFEQLLGDVDQIIEEQGKRYAENLQKVIDECEAEQELVRKRASGDGEQRKSTGNAELDKLIENARMLEVGTIIGFTDGERTRRETLAWIDEHRNKFVFVNTNGERASARLAQEMALELHQEKARVLSESDLPVIERGLYSVFSELQQTLAHDATHDKLTGLSNRKSFEEKLELALSQARVEHSVHTLLYIHLDDFAVIKEEVGSKAADALLTRLSRVLSKHLGMYGFVGRLDDEVFGALLEKTDEEKGLGISERHRKSVEQSRVAWKGKILPITVSVGMVCLDESATSADEALQLAAATCAEAMAAGGNRTYVHQPAFDDTDGIEVDAIDWEAEIPKILDNGLMQLYCQRIAPIGAAVTDSKAHAEVLLRLTQEDGSVRAPFEFIKAAERTGHVPTVDRWVIKNTFEWMADHKRPLMKSGGFAINLSGKSVSEAALLDYVLDELTRTKVPPAKILFEVTESAAIERPSVAIKFIEVMKEYGCRFCLDDFGTGSASFAYLKQLPVDYVKIDGMFVKDIMGNESDFAVVKSVNEISHFMGKRTIAEYVENDDIIARLADIGVDYGQGYGIHKPEPISL